MKHSNQINTIKQPIHSKRETVFAVSLLLSMFLDSYFICFVLTATFCLQFAFVFVKGISGNADKLYAVFVFKRTTEVY